MKQNIRIVIAISIVVLVGTLVLGTEWVRRSRAADVAPGSIPIYVGGRLQTAFTTGDLAGLEEVNFVDAEEGKTQSGWLLRDVLVQVLGETATTALAPDTVITVSSSSREKSVQLTWTEVQNLDNMVMFDVAGRGTLKLVSKLDRLDVRDEWVQDVDRIEVR